ncbi:dihydroxy-acid dehydratase [Salmonella enterica subsp. enterica serovar Typhimurium]|nr:dihydroxy-acid dehydratase [Salmonella enterica subsp. enterica serovar Typhimurium]
MRHLNRKESPNEPKCQHARDLWSQLDALRLGMNYSKEDVNKLQVLVDDCYGESHPGSFHLNQLGDEAVLGVHESGGRAVRHHVTDICDGWGQGHDGMNYILASREAIANMVEIHASVVPYDAGILISSCDKSIPAHLDCRRTPEPAATAYSRRFYASGTEYEYF